MSNERGDWLVDNQDEMRQAVEEMKVYLNSDAFRDTYENATATHSDGIVTISQDDVTITFDDDLIGRMAVLHGFNSEQICKELMSLDCPQRHKDD